MDLATGNVIGSTINGAMGLASSALNYHYNKKLAEQQNEYNLNMWNLQNEYNSPQAQMQRLEAAGLNPNLMYGQGNTGNAHSAPEQVTPNAPDFSFLKELGQAFNVVALRKNIAEMKSAEYDTQVKKFAAQDALDHYEARKHLAYDYTFDPLTGRFIPSDNYGDANIDYSARWYAMKALQDNFKATYLLPPKLSNITAGTNYYNVRTGLIPFTQDLQASQSQYYRSLAPYFDAQTRLLSPQIKMRSYEAQHYPFMYWFNNLGQPVIKSLPSFIPIML